MHKIIISLLLVFYGAINSFGQETKGGFPEKYTDEPRGENGLRIMFYNVENLFDTKDDPEKKDEEYCEGGSRNWSIYRYNQKLNNISTTIINVGGWEQPDIVGLCEIENRGCLDDLVKTPKLKAFNYQIVHFESPDRRGIDVGLLYNSAKLSIIKSEAVAVVFPWDKNYKTRDILYVSFKCINGAVLHCFVNHWPSKYGGAVKTIPSRVQAAKTARNRVNEIVEADKNANIILMGDFNDEAFEKSIAEAMNVKTKATAISDTNVVLIKDESSPFGSHKFHEHWSIIDHFMVSKSLANANNKLTITDKSPVIFSADYLMTDDEKYMGKMANRTYLGFTYKGGYSDHLPVYLDLVLD